MSTVVSMPQGSQTSANLNGIAPDFQAQQQQFCAWLRDPTQQPMPADVSPARMHIYRELLYHNVCNFIDMVYPIAQKLVGQAQWHAWQQQFFANYRCSSPFYLDISLHFRDFLQEDGATSDQLVRYPWLHELLQYEWLELYLDTMSNSMPNSMPDYQHDHQSHHQSIAQPAMTTWQLTRPIWVLVYQYPVYQWHTGMPLDDINTVSALPSAIMVWRAADHSVQMRSNQRITGDCAVCTTTAI